MDITFLGHSSFKLKGKSASLVTDPFDPEMVGLKFRGIEADIVTVSHDHKDHSRSDLVSGAEAVVQGPGEYEIKGVSFIGLSSYHDDQNGEKRGQNTIYIIEIDDFRIAHLGDLGHKLNDKTIDAIGEIDILFIPVGGEYTIGPSLAAEIVRDIEPTLIIPMHYKTVGLNDETFGKLAPVEEFLKEINLPVEKTAKYSVKKELLGEEQKVVLLEIKQ